MTTNHIRSYPRNSTKNKHAFLSPSTGSWINYSSDKLIKTYDRHHKAVLGTKLHKLAEMAIQLKQRMPRNKLALNQFINDAISWDMETEWVVYYSEYSFGSVDAISFDGRILRIHDLKTGVTPGKMRQLMIYAAIFCLEHDIDPNLIKIYLRIYQDPVGVNEEIPSSSIIIDVMKKIEEKNAIISDYIEILGGRR